MIPIDAPVPKPYGDSINHNQNDARPTLKRGGSPQISFNKGLANDPIDEIM